jgi:hypothetical protein
MRLSLIPENRQFYDLIEAAGKNVLEAAHVLDALLNDFTEVDAKLERLRALEHKGDEITAEAINALNQTFITPFDREDIAFLIRRLDDVVDFAWDAAMRLQAYSVGQVTETAIAFSRIICRQAEIIAGSLALLRKRGRMGEITAICKEIHKLENQADEILRGALAKRYNSAPHTVDGLINAMKWSEIYAILEKATDRAEDIADTMQGMMLKYA